MALNILSVTGSRADWGLLSPVLSAARDTNGFRLELAVTGQHLMPGINSRDTILADGFKIDHDINLNLDASDSALTVAHAASHALAGVGELLAKGAPDLLLVLGDRYEIFAAATAALFFRVPVAHLCGGDLTEGVIDDSMRHGLTKLSHLHFVSNAQAARRVAQLGEDPLHIFNVGSPGLDRIRQIVPLSRNDFFAEIGFAPRSRNVIVTFHPITLAADSIQQCQAMLAAIDQFDELGILITGSNADAEGRQIDALTQAFASVRDNVRFFPTLGSHLYFSALSHVDAVVGNSSSGIYEAPSFFVPTVNIGDRQKGRPQAASVICCAPEVDAIYTALNRALALDCTGVKNPYGDGHAAGRIVAALKAVGDPARLLQKRFSDYHI